MKGEIPPVITPIAMLYLDNIQEAGTMNIMYTTIKTKLNASMYTEGNSKKSLVVLATGEKVFQTIAFERLIMENAANTTLGRNQLLFRALVKVKERTGEGACERSEHSGFRA